MAEENLTDTGPQRRGDGSAATLVLDLFETLALLGVVELDVPPQRIEARVHEALSAIALEGTPNNRECRNDRQTDNRSACCQH